MTNNKLHIAKSNIEKSMNKYYSIEIYYKTSK